MFLYLKQVVYIEVCAWFSLNIDLKEVKYLHLSQEENFRVVYSEIIEWWEDWVYLCLCASKTQEI